MKKLLLSIALAVTCVTGYSQTATNTPAPWLDSPWWDFLSRTNLSVVTYGIYDETDEEFGAGLALAYRVNQLLVAAIRIEAAQQDVYQTQLNIQLQYPIRVAGRFDVIPLAYEGVAVPFQGANDANFDPANVVGAGLALGFRTDSSFLPDGVVVTYEWWSGGRWNNNQWRAGLWWSFP